jgi:TolB protein
MGRRRWTVVAALLLVSLLPLASALATAPGTNGDIAFRRYLGPDRTKGAIFIAHPDGTGERQLTSNAEDDYPDVSPDGRFVAFQRCDEVICEIWVANSDGSSAHRVGDNCHRPPPKCADDSYPAISPDGKQIAFVRAFGRIKHDQIAHVGIYRMRLDGTHLRKVTLPPTRKAEDGDPQWSPDGKRVVLVRHVFTAKSDKQAIFTVRANGKGLKRVTRFNLRAGDGPDWSPDGSQILFRSPETEDFLNSNIWTIHPDGTGLRQVTQAGPGVKVYSASFSPDGTRITLGMSGVDDQADVYTIGVDGTGLTPVTRTAQWDSAPDWGPAG